MKKHIFTALTLALLMIAPYSCEDQLEYTDATRNGVCNVDNPLEDLEWLKDLKQGIQLSMQAAGSQIIQYTYMGEPVFWVDQCYMCADGLIMVYNCNGDVICEFGGIDGRNTCPDFATEATDSTNLFISINN